MPNEFEKLSSSYVGKDIDEFTGLPNTLTRYTGNAPHFEIPENIHHIEPHAFAGTPIESLIVPPLVMSINLFEDLGLRNLKTLVLKHTYYQLSLRRLLQIYTKLETLELHAIQKIYLPAKLPENRHLLIRVPDEDIRLIEIDFGIAAPVRIELFVPFISPGKVNLNYRFSLIKTFLDHPDWYPEDRRAAYLGWLRKNSEKFFPLCIDYGFSEIVLECLSQEDLRLPVKAYDRIIECGKAKKIPELTSKALEAKTRYYDLEKLARRQETTEANDLMDPLRAHAMRDFWGWSNQEDGTLVLKKLKTHPDTVSVDKEVLIPPQIGQKPVTMVSGPVFSKTGGSFFRFPDSVTHLSGNLFQGNSEVLRVTFDGPIDIIPAFCFRSCRGLSSVILTARSQCIGSTNLPPTNPDPEKTLAPLLIGSQAFEYCSRITTLSLSNAILSSYTFSSSGIVRLCLRHVPIIPSYCFSQASVIDADIQGTQIIDFSAFAFCENLVTIHVSDDLLDIERAAFTGCPKFKYVHLHHVKDPDRIRNLFQRLQSKPKLEYLISED